MTVASSEPDVRQAPSDHITYQVLEWQHIPVEPSRLLVDGKLNVYASVLKGDYFQLRPQKGGLTLQAGAFIGVIPLNDYVTIEVAPRVPMHNLSRVLRISKQSPQPLERTTRWYEHEPEMYPSLVDLYARALIDQVDEIRLKGLTRDYERRQEATSFPRGRIMMNETVKSLVPRGMSQKVVASWYQRTIDIPVNRCLKYAIWFLARSRRDLVRARAATQSRSIMRGLNRAYRLFDGVELDIGRRFMSDPVVLGIHDLPSVRAYYRSALALSLAVIQQRAVTLDRGSGDLKLPSLLVNMSDVFEDYLRNIVIERATSESWSLSVLNGNHDAPRGGKRRLLHTGVEVKASPDVVVASDANGDQTFPVLVEVKYKPSDRPLDRDDLNQAISYAVSYRAPHVVLAQPRGGGADVTSAGLHELGTIENVTIHQYVFDLDAEDLAEEEARFCDAIRHLADPLMP